MTTRTRLVPTGDNNDGTASIKNLGIAAGILLLQVDVRPDPAGLPGTAQLQTVVNGLAWWALLACVAAVLIGAGAWAFGSRAGNYSAVGNGKSLVAGGIIGGFLVGAASAIVNFFTSVGSGVAAGG